LKPIKGWKNHWIAFLLFGIDGSTAYGIVSSEVIENDIPEYLGINIIGNFVAVLSL
jgi:hypothetical protein